MVEDRADAPAVLALEPVVELEALLDLVQPPRLAFERVGVATQLQTEVLGLEPKRGEALGQPVELGVDAPDRLGEPLGLGQQRSRAPLPRGGGDRLGTAGRRREQPVQRAQAPAFHHERVLIALARAERLDLLDLEREQVEIAVAGAGEPAELR